MEGVGGTARKRWDTGWNGGQPRGRGGMAPWKGEDGLLEGGGTAPWKGGTAPWTMGCPPVETG